MGDGAAAGAAGLAGVGLGNGKGRPEGGGAAPCAAGVGLGLVGPPVVVPCPVSLGDDVSTKAAGFLGTLHLRQVDGQVV